MALLNSAAFHWPRFGGAYWRNLGLCLLALMLSAGGQAQPAGVPSKEYQLKAVFLFNFALFVEWPSAAFPEAGTPLVIGILGDDPFGDYLDGLIKDEKSHDRAISVRRFRRVEDVALCHVLFICPSEAERLVPTLAALRARSILTVSDIPEFTRNGGMVRFLTENSKIRLRINLDAAKAAGLTLSSKVLRPAQIVTSRDP